MKTEQKWKIGDCLELLPEIPDKSIEMVLTDLPYGITGCDWDNTIKLDCLWSQYHRITKENAVIILFGSQPFTTDLINSNRTLFRYEIIWEKSRPTGFFTAKIQPLKIHENILIFYKEIPTYNPQKLHAKRNNIDKRKTLNPTINPYLGGIKKKRIKDNGLRYPTTIEFFNSISEEGQHSSQKPLALFEYLIKTYTNEGDTVHDSCLGSGTTLEACMNLNRNCIGYEIDPQWEPIYCKRLKLDNTKLDAFNTSACPK